MRTSNPCDVVVERIALGESLGELADHVTTCAACQRLKTLPAALGVVHGEVAPAAGFSARMALGAREQLTIRRRRRIAGTTAAGVAAAALVVFVVTREPDEAREHRAATHSTPEQPADPSLPAAAEDVPDEPSSDDSVDDDLRALVQLADTERALRASARWDRIEQPLAPYRHLVEGVSP